MKISLAVILFFISFSSIAQKQGNYWYFGVRAGLDFSSAVPVVIQDGKTGTDLTISQNQEGTSVISDSAGYLLFYTSGKTIWNRDHYPMPNGTGVFGGVSSTQSSLIVPLPGSDNLFYVFTSDEFQNYSPPHTPLGYRYSIVDMCLDDGRGDVVIDKKNVLLIDSATEKLSACEDANGNGYWIMGHKMRSRSFYAWHLTSAGITETVITDIGVIHGLNHYTGNFSSGTAQGQMKFNPQGIKLAITMGNYDPAIIELFDFNKSTGVLSNLCHFSIDSTGISVLGARAYGIEFSPDGLKLYAAISGSGSNNPTINQYNLAAGNCAAIAASRVILLPSNTTSAKGLQLGPDNKIYVTQAGAVQGCINFPDILGTGADFNPAALDLSPGLNAYAFPSFVAGYKYHNRIPCDTSTIDPPPPTVVPSDSTCNLGIKTRLYPNPTVNILLVDKKATKCKVTMCLYNILGQVVMQNIAINDGITEIHLSGLSVGVYYYKFVSDEKNVFTGTVVKQ